MKHRQNGLSLIGLLIVAALLGFAFLVAVRTVPAINEYFAVKRSVNLIAEEGDDGAAPAELRRSFDRRRQIDDIGSVSGEDLAISQAGGRTLVEVEYERRVPLVANVSLLFDFRASSDDR